MGAYCRLLLACVVLAWQVTWHGLRVLRRTVSAWPVSSGALAGVATTCRHDQDVPWHVRSQVGCGAGP
jgi:hypothetical protein